jgi:hypothetical protein
MFLTPLALIGFGLLALPIAIHALTRRRAERRDFPSLEFLRETPSFKLRPRRIQQPLLLAIRLFALSLLVLAFARPYFHASRRATVILIDCSLSMAAGDRANAAKDEARRLISALPAREPVAIFAFSSDSFELSGMSEDKAALTSALDKYKINGGGSDYQSGIEAAKRTVSESGADEGSIHVISDFQRGNVKDAGQLKSPFEVITHAVGSPLVRNAHPGNIWLSHTEKGPVLVHTELTDGENGRHSSVRQSPLSPRFAAADGTEIQNQTNGQLTGAVSANSPDTFDADDKRYFAFGPELRDRVLLVETGTEADDYWRAALESATASADKRAVESAARLSALESLAPYSLVIFTLTNKTSEAELKALTEYAQAGGSVWLQIESQLDTTSTMALLRAAGIGLPFEHIERVRDARDSFLQASDQSAPIFDKPGAGLLSSIYAVKFKRSFDLAPGIQANVLMRWSSGEPALVQQSTGRGQFLFWPLSLERSVTDLGTSPAFPLLVSSIVEEAVARDRAESVCGEPVWLGGDTDAPVAVFDQAGHEGMTTVRDMLNHPLRSMPLPGVYKIQADGTDRFIAINPPAVESDQELAGAEEIKALFAGKDSPNKLSKDAARHTPDIVWRYLLGATFVILAFETLYWLRGRQPAIHDGDTRAEEIG